jgi:hypothetical protein
MDLQEATTSKRAVSYRRERRDWRGDRAVAHSSIANPVWDPLDSVRSIIGDLERSVPRPTPPPTSQLSLCDQNDLIQATCLLR